MSNFSPTLDLNPSLYDDVLMTILPKHADRLYSGAKRFEFRKAIPRAVPRRIFLYETGKTGAITGHIIIDEVLVGSPEYIWSVTGEAGTSRESFQDYFTGRQLAYALRIGAAIRYSESIPLKAALEIEPGFRVPQNFLYMQNLPALRLRLSQIAVDQVLNASAEPLKLRRLAGTERASFISLVREHVSKGYLETGRTYAEKLLAIADQGEDPEGFLTLSKHICCLYFRSRAVGFAVITMKLGGSIKTGPVILAEGYRKKGIGKSARNIIHQVARSLGYRKVFATVPANNIAAVQYLLSSDYRVEAHLTKPYHSQHDELVLGKLLESRRGACLEFIRQITPFNDCMLVNDPCAEIATFLKTEFSAAYCRVSDEWALRQVRLATHEQSAFKPRFVLAGYNSALIALALCLPKRGGSAKIIVLTKSGHQGSLVGLLRLATTFLSRAMKGRLRRVYSQVPVGDTDVINAFLTFGCRPEGIIEVPFSPSTDTLILAKQVQPADWNSSTDDSQD